jgi:hypothetical protein
MVSIRMKNIVEGNKYWVRESEADDWLAKIVKKVPKSRSLLILEDITPDGPEIWHQKREGGIYKTQFVNGFRGEKVEKHIRCLYERKE